MSSLPSMECTQAWGPSVSVFSPASDGSSDESDLATEQSSPSPSIVASVPLSAQLSGVDIDVLRTWRSKNTAHFSSWMIKNYNIP